MTFATTAIGCAIKLRSVSATSTPKNQAAERAQRQKKPPSSLGYGPAPSSVQIQLAALEMPLVRSLCLLSSRQDRKGVD